MEGTSALAGMPAPPPILVNVPRLVTSYYTEVPDPSIPAQRVVFGTSGHRGSAFEHSFNEWHVLAISQAICRYRTRRGITGPLFLGVDTHALSVPAHASALEVLAADGVDVTIARDEEYTSTPAGSRAILKYNRGPTAGQPAGERRLQVQPAERGPRGRDRDSDYVGRGVPDGPDEGTLAPWAVAASLPFAPEIVLPVLEHCIHDLKLTESNRYGFKASFNPTYSAASGNPHGWVSPWHFRLNEGPTILMIENHRTDLLWRLMRNCSPIVTGLRHAGFRGGWL